MEEPRRLRCRRLAKPFRRSSRRLGRLAAWSALIALVGWWVDFAEHPLAQQPSALDRVQNAVRAKADKAIVSLSLSGTVTATQISGAELQRELEIRVLLPDHYLRIERWKRPAGTVTFLHGYSQDRLLNDVRTDSPELNFGFSAPGPEGLLKEKRDAALMLLGVIGEALPIVSLDSPQAISGVIAVTVAERSVHLRLSSAGLPDVLTYRTSIRLPAPGKKLTVPPSPTDVDVTMAFRDRRLVDGFSLPHRITTKAGEVVLQEIVVAHYEVNPSLTVADFR